MIAQTRRRFIGSAALAGAAGLVGMPTARAAEPPPETTTVRLPRIPAVCIAPQYVAEELLRAEGFTDVRYVDGTPGSTELVARGEVDFDSNYASNFGQGIDRGEPITLLSGVMVGCFELFAARASARSPI